MIGLSNCHRWLLPGLLVTLVLALLSVVALSPAMERDLIARGGRALVSDGQDWAGLSVDGRVATLSGTAPSAAAQSLAVQSLTRSWGIASVIDDSGLLPIAAPFTWSATLAEETISLAGYLPSIETRTALLAAIRERLPTALIQDGTELARGAPANFDALLAFAVARLAELAGGSIALSDTELSVSGTAGDMTAYTSASAALRDGLPDGFSLAALDLMPPRAETFTWSAAYEDNWITLGGLVTSDAARESLAARARAVIPGVQVADRMSLASGAPDSLDAAADYLFSLLPYLGRGKVGLAGQALSVSGTASSVDSYEAILEVLGRAPPPGFDLAAVEIAPATVAPYVWRADKTGSGVVIAGYAPSAAERDEAVAAARAVLADQQVESRLRVAAGAPRMDWIGAIKFAVAQLARLRTGSVEMSDRSFSIAGEAASSGRFAELSEILARTLPASLQLARAEVSPPIVSPYRLSADLAEERLLLAGHVPSEAVRTAITEAAKAIFGDIDILDQLAFGGGAPPDLAVAVTAGLRALGRASQGSLVLSDRRLDVDAVTFSAAAVEPTLAALRAALPPAYAVDATIVPPEPLGIVPPDECQQLLRAQLADRTVEFAQGEAELLEESRRLLDRLAAHLQRCPASLIEIGGHTDSSGGPAKNKALSTARAEAVLKYLVSIGVVRERLTAVGYGEENPIASNRTDAGRSRNRRIEFTVVTALPTQPETGSE